MTNKLEKQSTEIKQHGGVRPGAGRPRGSTNRTTAEIRDLASRWGPAAIEKAAHMAGLVIDEEGNLIDEAESEQVRLAALGLLLDRGFGRPAAATAIAGMESGSVEVTLHWGEVNAISTARRVAFLLGRAVHQQKQAEGTE